MNKMDAIRAAFKKSASKFPPKADVPKAAASKIYSARTKK